MLPQRGRTNRRDKICPEEWDSLIQEVKIAGFGSNSVGQIYHPDMIIRAGNILRRTFFFRPGSMNRVAILQLLGGQIPQHLLGPFRLAICLGQHVLSCIPKANASHTGGVRADGTGITGGLDTLQRVPGVDHSLGVCVGKIALIHCQMLAPPALELCKLPIRLAVFPECSQRLVCAGNSPVIIGQSSLGYAKEEVNLLVRACLQADVRMQRTAGLAALQIGVGEAPILDFNRISLIPVIAAEHVPVAAEGVDSCIRAKVHERGFVLARVHPGGIGIGDSLQVLIKHSPGVPLEIIAEDVFLPRKILAELHISKDVAGDFLATFVFELQIPHQRVIILRHEELQGGGQAVLFRGKGGGSRRVAGLPGIH